MKREPEPEPCPLCGSGGAEPFHSDPDGGRTPRDYWRCLFCRLIYVPRSQHLAPQVEHSRYLMHRNDPDDPEYRRFLSQLSRPMLERLEPGSTGLDFGSGPGPALNLMFEESGHRMRIYDLFFENDCSVFEQTYDFVTLSETVEHLGYPLAELDHLWEVLRSGGWLGIMTLLYHDSEPFGSWHYKNHDTHIVFFSEETFRWLQKYWSCRLEILSDRVALFQKPF